MPKITITRSEGGIPTTTSTPRMSGQVGEDLAGALGAGLQKLGGRLTEIEREKKKKEEEIATAEYISTASIEATEQITRLEKKMKESTTNFNGFADNFTDQVDTIYGQILANAPTEEARLKLMKQFTSSRNSLFKSAFKFEGTQRRAAATSSAESNLEILGARLLDNPELLEVTTEQLEGVERHLGTVLDKEALRGYSKKARAYLATQYISGLTKNDPAKALEALQSGRMNGVLDGKAQFALEKNILGLEASRNTFNNRFEKEADDKTEFNLLTQDILTEEDIKSAVANGFSHDRANILIREIGKGATQSDDFDTLTQMNRKLIDGELTVDWLAKNRSKLTPATTKSALEKITSNVANNPSVKRAAKQIDALFEVDPITGGFLGGESDQELSAEYYEDLISRTLEEERPSDIANEIKGNHKLRKEFGPTQFAKERSDLVSKMGGIDNINKQSVSDVAKDIAKRLREEAITHEQAKRETEALKELHRLNNIGK